MINVAYVLPILFLVFMIGVIVGVKREQKNTDMVFAAWRRSTDSIIEILDKQNLQLVKLLDELKKGR